MPAPIHQRFMTGRYKLFLLSGLTNLMFIKRPDNALFCSEFKTGEMWKCDKNHQYGFKFGNAAQL